MLLLLPPLPSGLGLGMLCLSRAAALGFNQSLWVYAAELLPTAVRASGTAACSKLPGQSATSPTLGGPEAVRLPPCTLEEGAAAARSSGRSSVEAGYATSTADFHTPHSSSNPQPHPLLPPPADNQQASGSSRASRASPASWLPTRSLVSGTSRTPQPWAYAVRAACWPPRSSTGACRATPWARPCATLSVNPSSL